MPFWIPWLHTRYLGDDDDVIKELHQYAVEAKSSASPENLKFIHVSGDDFGESVAKMVGCTKKDHCCFV